MAKRAWRYWEATFQADEVCEMNPVWPWGGHRRFAYDLARWVRPTRIAELGVHWGTSFFTFAQAMKDGRMKDTELIGVDTFEGEDHAGHYGPEVYDTVQRILAQYFPKQRIELCKMFFEEALQQVDDESVDLLHIDGLHTFEAVKNDFDSWLPKLAPDGVVLLHDVAPDTGYGSTDYWNQIVKEHPGFAFEHSWGLGVLFPKGDTRLERLRQDGLEDKIVAYTALANAERAGRELHDVGRMARERLGTINQQGEKYAELRDQLRSLRESTVPSEAHEKVVARAESASQLAKERYEAIQKQSELVLQRDGQIESLHDKVQAARKMAQDRLESMNQALARAVQAERVVAKLEPRAAAAVAARDELRGRVQDFRDRVNVQDERLGEVRAMHKTARERNDELRERNAGLREKLAARDTSIQHLRGLVESATSAQKTLEQSLADMAEHVSALASSHSRDRTHSAEKLGELSSAVEQARRAGEAAAATLARRMTRLDTDADLLSMRADYVEEIVADQREQLKGSRTEGEVAQDWLTGEPIEPDQEPRENTGRGKHPRNS